MRVELMTRGVSMGGQGWSRFGEAPVAPWGAISGASSRWSSSPGHPKKRSLASFGCRALGGGEFAGEVFQFLIADLAWPATNRARLSFRML